MLQAKDVMDSSAALLNDTALTKFTYVKQLPYLQIAIDELQEVMEENNISWTNETDTEIVILAGATETTLADIPTDLIEVRMLYERLNGASEDWQFMSKVDFLPPMTTQTESLIYWEWTGELIKFIGATTDRQLKLQYISNKLTKLIDHTTSIKVRNCKTFLEFRNAGLCAFFIGENKERADALNLDAGLALERFISIGNKSRQVTPTRRRPFMANYKIRTGF